MKYHIYLIRQGGTDYYKIGLSRNPVEQRLKSLQTGCPNELEIVDVFTTEYGFVLERSIQRAYEHKKVFGGGDEWFELSIDEVRQFRDKCTMTDYNMSVLIDSKNPYIKK
jgi:hypothetical protein